MRKILEAISLAALAILFWITYAALFGPQPLASPIPTHFNLSGQPDAWGNPLTLLMIPGLAIVLDLLMTFVSHFPAAFNYPVRVTPQNRPRLQHLALNMIAFIKAETVTLLTLVQYFSIQTARLQRSSLPPALMIAAIAIIFATILLHIVAMRRA
jgi:uncharacterized membrane protein